MHVSKSVIAVSAAFFAVGIAADGIAFTSWPTQIQAGKPVTLTWSGADPNQPVTINLRKGNSSDLKNIQTVTAQANGGAFTWTPSDNISDGSDYAFEVKQGDQNNYTGQLTASGGKVESPQSSSQSGSTTTSGRSSTGSKTSTSSQTTTTARKALITSSASPSNGPASSAMASSSHGPAMSSTKVANGKAKVTDHAHHNGASIKMYSLDLAVGALALFVYLW